jgi:hypothetical protein
MINHVLGKYTLAFSLYNVIGNYSHSVGKEKPAFLLENG